MKDFLIKSAVCASICLLFASITMASSASYSNLIVFGDSLSDEGNNTWVKTEGKVGAPITNIDTQTGHRSLWPNYLIANPGLFNTNPDGTRVIYPVSQASQRGYSPFRYSMNYAWASAETSAHYINDLDLRYPYNDQACAAAGAGKLSDMSSCVPGVLLQVKNYLNDVQNHPNPHSLIIIWAGGNDLFNNIAKVAEQNKGDSKPLLLLKMFNVPFPLLSNSTKKEPLSNPVKNIKEAVVMLIEAGVPAQNIYVINMPNLADTPAAQSFAKGNKVMLYSLAAITEIFNMALRIDLAFNYFKPTFNLPNGNIISANRVFHQILKNAQALGFNKLLRDCVQDKATPDCQGYIFFNGKHPTTSVHKDIADDLNKILNSK